MRLSVFIASNLEAIMADWVAFARKQQPAAASMDENALRDHGKLILEEIVADMSSPQGEGERQAKSEGNSNATSEHEQQPSRSHARQREQQGFRIEQLVAEYRALRATVLRLWAATPGGAQTEDLEEVTRFNEAVDQAIAESVEVFVGEVDKARELFLGVLSHDLRGPLSAISASAALLARGAPQDARSVDVLFRSVAHMTALLDDLRIYTRQRLGAGFSITAEPLRLDRFVRDTLDEIDAIKTGRMLQMETLGDMQGRWDPRRLHQALSNLVFNAVKYGVASSPIRVALDGRQADEVVLSVHNQGVVIPDDMLERIFDPLVRATAQGGRSDAPPAGANLGLGLYVVREIASAHGGSVEVSSDDSGTRFELKLPRVSRPAGPTGPPAPGL